MDNFFEWTPESQINEETGEAHVTVNNVQAPDYNYITESQQVTENECKSN